MDSEASGAEDDDSVDHDEYCGDDEPTDYGKDDNDGESKEQRRTGDDDRARDDILGDGDDEEGRRGESATTQRIESCRENSRTSALRVRASQHARRARCTPWGNVPKGEW